MSPTPSSSSDPCAGGTLFLLAYSPHTRSDRNVILGAAAAGDTVLLHQDGVLGLMPRLPGVAGGVQPRLRSGLPGPRVASSVRRGGLGGISRPYREPRPGGQLKIPVFPMTLPNVGGAVAVPVSPRS